MPRPKLPPGERKIAVSYKLAPWIVRWLREQDRPASQLIEEAVAKHNKLEEPKDGA